MRALKLFALSILMVLCLMATGAALGEEAVDTAPAQVDEVPTEMVEAEDETAGEIPDDAAEVEAESEIPDDAAEVDEGEVTIETKTDEAGTETYVCRYCIRRYAKRDKTVPKADGSTTDGTTDGTSDATTDAATDSAAETVVCKYCGRSFVKGGPDDSASYTKGSRGKRSYGRDSSTSDAATDGATDGSADANNKRYRKSGGNGNRPNMKGGSYYNNRGTSGCNCNCNCQGGTAGDNAQTRPSDRSGNRQKSTRVRPKG